MGLNEPFIVIDEISNGSSWDEIFLSFDNLSPRPTFGDINDQNSSLETHEQDTLLKLPPTPQRNGKRKVKRTHPVLEGNIDELKGTKTKKQMLEMEKQARKEIRADKKKLSICLQIEKAEKRKQKDDEKLRRLQELKNNL